MLRQGCKIGLLWLAAAAPWACTRDCPPVTLDATYPPRPLRYEPLAELLSLAVRKNGLANAEMLEKHADVLDAQLRRLAVAGPTATPELLPDPNSRLAYWYNARAAWAMKLLLVERCEKRVHADSLRRRRFPLDARQISLAQLDAILAGEDDFRVAVAAPGVTTHDARLPAEPFDANTIADAVAERFAEFIDDPMRLVIDVRHKEIAVPRRLWQFRERLIEQYERAYGTEGATLVTALLPHLDGSPHRRLQRAIGYRAVLADERYLPVTADKY